MPALATTKMMQEPNMRMETSSTTSHGATIRFRRFTDPAISRQAAISPIDFPMMTNTQNVRATRIRLCEMMVLTSQIIPELTRFIVIELEQYANPVGHVLVVGQTDGGQENGRHGVEHRKATDQQGTGGEFLVEADISKR
jgi:hypothetical protein